MSVARIGEQKIFLIAGKGLTDAMTAVFRIGLPESADWPAGTGYGTAMPGSWGAVQVNADNTSTRNGIATDGSAVTVANTFFSMGLNGPLGMRSLPKMEMRRRIMECAKSPGLATRSSGSLPVRINLPLIKPVREVGVSIRASKVSWPTPPGW